MNSGDYGKFWKSYKYSNHSKSSQSARINGLIDAEIANCFADNLSHAYRSNDATQTAKLCDEFKIVYDKYHAEHFNDSISFLYLSWSEMIDIFSKLEVGTTASFLKPEHILYGSPRLARHIHILSNAMTQHSYVPHKFMTGSITPLIKDSQDHNSPNNYRGLTLGVVFCNLFEQHC